ncbi:MAG: hypothetical protein H6696_17070 [Deferribacteres bacterium]|nr:hypothetical protein [candidate division KSB1 bacterium]MCB9503647.1 hypothetical protein [Deferribacteres bacterium]
MNLKKITLYTIIGISFIFITKTMATFVPGFYNGLRVAKINSLLLFAASLPVVGFFVAFKKTAIQDDQETLRLASLIAISTAAGTSLVLFADVLALFKIQNMDLNFERFGVELLYSLSLLYFFIVFNRGNSTKMSSALKQAVFLALVGAAFSAIIQSYIFMSYVTFGDIRLVGYNSPHFPLLLIPLFIFMFFAKFYFFLTYYREIGSDSV